VYGFTGTGAGPPPSERARGVPRGGRGVTRGCIMGMSERWTAAGYPSRAGGPRGGRGLRGERRRSGPPGDAGVPAQDRV